MVLSKSRFGTSTLVSLAAIGVVIELGLKSPWMPTTCSFSKNNENYVEGSLSNMWKDLKSALKSRFKQLMP